MAITLNGVLMGRSKTSFCIKLLVYKVYTAVGPGLEHRNQVRTQ